MNKVKYITNYLSNYLLRYSLLVCFIILMGVSSFAEPAQQSDEIDEIEIEIQAEKSIENESGTAF